MCRLDMVIIGKVTLRYLLLTLLFSWSVICWGQEATEPEGEGTSANPFKISSLENLYWIAADASRWDKHYRQTSDIDASGTETWNDEAGWSPIGNNIHKFTGVYDGGGYSITDLYINRPSVSCQGLFGFIDGATIENVVLNNVEITGNNYVGSLVGRNTLSTAIVRNCFSSGHVLALEEGNSFAGGLIGESRYLELSSSYSEVNVISLGNVVGGLVGFNSTNSSIVNCYSKGNITGNNHVGGLVGRNIHTITTSYSIGYVDGSGTDVGGFCGSLHTNGSVIDSFWDKDTSGQQNSAGGSGKNTLDMLQEETFTNWDFTDVWDIVEGHSYPFLRWQGEAGEHNIPAFMRKMERDGVNYVITFSGWDGDVSVSLINVAETKIDITYTTYSSHPAVQLFPSPENLGAYYRFDVGDGNIFKSGSQLKLQFDLRPNNLWFRGGSGDWYVMQEGSDWTWDGTHAVITNLNFNPTRGQAIFEYAGDKGVPGETLPVELSFFSAIITADMFVKLSWTAETETNMLGYNVLRSPSQHISEAVKVNYAIIGARNSSKAIDYMFIDKDVDAGVQYYYWLQANDLDLSYMYHGPIAIMVDDPQEESGGIVVLFQTELQGAYPNPFNPGTNISFSLSEAANVTIDVYNAKGQFIRKLIDDESFQKARNHRVYWDGNDYLGNQVGSGVYLYKMQTDDGFREVKKMIMMK